MESMINGNSVILELTRGELLYLEAVVSIVRNNNGIHIIKDVGSRIIDKHGDEVLDKLGDSIAKAHFSIAKITETAKNCLKRDDVLETTNGFMDGLVPEESVKCTMCCKTGSDSGKLRAFASVSVRGLSLNSLRVYEGSKGLFVSYPNDPAHSGEDYRQIFFPLRKELRNEIERVVLKTYNDLE